MKKNIFLGLLLIANAYLGFGQYPTFVSPFSFFKKAPDTLPFEKLPKPIKVSNLDSVKFFFIDTLNNPTAYVVKSNIFSTTDYSIAIKRKNYYSVYPLDIGTSKRKVDSMLIAFKAEDIALTEIEAKRGVKPSDNILDRNGYFNRDSIVKIYKFRIGSEKNELVIIAFFQSYVYTLGSGHSSYLSGYKILDLDRQLIFTLLNTQTNIQWPYGNGMVATNSGGPGPFNFEEKIYFKNKLLNIEPRSRKKKFTYTYSKGKFIRLK